MLDTARSFSCPRTGGCWDEMPSLRTLLSLAIRWSALANDNQARDNTLRSSGVDVHCCAVSVSQTCYFSYPAHYPHSVWCLKGLWLGNPGLVVPLHITSMCFLQQCFPGFHLFFQFPVRKRTTLSCDEVLSSQGRV